jgi:hypothetical protein
VLPSSETVSVSSIVKVPAILPPGVEVQAKMMELDGSGSDFLPDPKADISA